MIEEGDSIYGDGVNIAARIESLAEAGGICISGSAYEQIENKLPLKYDYLGEHEVKNIAKPVRVYRAQIEPEKPSQAKVKAKAEGKNWKYLTITCSAGRDHCSRGSLAVRPAALRRLPAEKAYPIEDGFSSS